MWGIKFKYFDILNKYKLFSTLFEVTSHQKRSFVSFKIAIYWPKITINRAGYIYYTNNQCTVRNPNYLTYSIQEGEFQSYRRSLVTKNDHIQATKWPFLGPCLVSEPAVFIYLAAQWSVSCFIFNVDCRKRGLWPFLDYLKPKPSNNQLPKSG